MSHSEEHVSRREFVSTALMAPVLAAWTPSVGSGPVAAAPPRILASPSSVLKVDYRELLERADLHYERPPARSEEGIPVGNGRMGSLVWTTPSAMKLQINRVDVYGNDCHTNSFFERHSDYCGGCGFVDIAFGDAGEEVFPTAGFPQHLFTYDGILELRGKDLTAKVLAWPEQDVMAVEVDDRRQAPEPIRVNLRMLRYASQYFGGALEEFVEHHIVPVQTRNHRATSQLTVRGDRIVLLQEFREGDYYNRSAVAIGVNGRNAQAKVASDSEVRLTTEPGSGSLTLLIASAASFDPNEDVVAFALEQLETAARKDYRELATETAEWWHDFWADGGFIHLRSDDGIADYVERHYNYFLYLMGASSRGMLPPKFNGMLWNTAGDLRSWGGQHWFANLSCYYEGLSPTDRFALMDPAFDMYSGMYEASATAARQQWGSEGIFIPETVFFNGLAELPEEVAREMRVLYLLEKPWEERSERFRAFAATKHPHCSRWNWKGSGDWVDGHWTFTDKGAGPFGHTTHILATTAKVAYLYWRRYEYTLDRAWLRDRAYPMLKGAVEFYRHFPNLRQGTDGKYHLHHVNSNESASDVTDTDEDISALRGLLPAAIRASEILNEDVELRSAWRAFLEDVPPLPTSDHPSALKPKEYGGPEVFVRGLGSASRGKSAFLPDRNSLPMWFFDLCHVGTEDRAQRETAVATFEAYFPDGVTEKTPVSVLSKVGIAAAALGRVEAVRYLLPNQLRALRPEREIAYRDGGVLANRMSLREGPQALAAERLGRVAEALHLALLQSYPPSPGGDPVIQVFPAWPAEWDASYQLLARGAFLVTASMRDGRVEFVELASRAGGACRLRNPWGEDAVTLYRDGAKAEGLAGSLLQFPTDEGETVVVVASGDTPEAYRRTLPSA